MRASNARLRAGAIASVLAALLPMTAVAQTFEYSLILKARLDTGAVIDMPGLPISDFPRCIYERNRTEIGRKFSPGGLVLADGTSPGGTIIGVRCEEHKWGLGD